MEQHMKVTRQYMVLCALVIFFLGHPLHAQWARLTTHILTDLKGFYGTENVAYAVGDGGTIIKTTDGGSTWMSVQSSVQKNLWAVNFYHANEVDEVGYVVGDDGVILKTSNGGATWESQNSNLHTGILQSFLFGIFSLDRETWYAAGGDGEAGSGVVLKTIDGGEHWTKSLVPDAFFLDKCFFTDAMTGYAVGLGTTGGGIIMKTTDGGATWQKKYTANSIVSSLYCTGSGVCFAVGNNGAIFRTTDGGESWTQQNSGVSADLLSVYFSDSQSGVIAGDLGTVLKTTDAGEHWTAISYSESVFLDAVQSVGNSVFAAGNGGTILKLDAPSDVQEREGALVQIGASPNPFSGQTTLHISKVHQNGLPCFLTIYNAIGSAVRHIPVEGEQITVSSAGLPSGKYLYVISNMWHILGTGQITIQ